MSNKQHDFHLVDPSPWPLIGALSAFTMFAGLVMFMHGVKVEGVALGHVVFPLGLLAVLGVMFVWWRDVIREVVRDKIHTDAVQRGLRIGMALFILSEVMFFFAFFWSFFKAELAPVLHFSGYTIFEGFSKGVFPPEGVKTFDPWELPLANTLILLLSGCTVTWAHYELIHGNRKGLIQGLACTVLLGLLFTCTQAIEYSHAPFKFKDGIYSSNFFMATGFHGAHVIIGTIFLTVCLFRAMKGQFSEKHHLGFEFAAWYWHFVDVVWLFLFTFVYVFGR